MIDDFDMKKETKDKTIKAAYKSATISKSSVKDKPKPIAKEDADNARIPFNEGVAGAGEKKLKTN